MKQFQQPLISILIANYNNSRYLKRCINSCLKQTYKNFEIIVFDDASTDDSIKELKKFKHIK
jgi:glycosyltransferase involved in cell wall biosynthesis